MLEHQLIGLLTLHCTLKDSNSNSGKHSNSDSSVIGTHETVRTSIKSWLYTNFNRIVVRPLIFFIPIEYYLTVLCPVLVEVGQTQIGVNKLTGPSLPVRVCSFVILPTTVKKIVAAEAGHQGDYTEDNCEALFPCIKTDSVNTTLPRSTDSLNQVIESASHPDRGDKIAYSSDMIDFFDNIPPKKSRTSPPAKHRRDMKKTLAVLLHSLMQRISTLEAQISSIRHSGWIAGSLKSSGNFSIQNASFQRRHLQQQSEDAETIDYIASSSYHSNDEWLFNRHDDSCPERMKHHSNLLTERLGQPGSISALVVSLGGLAAKHRKGATAKRFFCICEGGEALLDNKMFHCDNSVTGAAGVEVTADVTFEPTTIGNSSGTLKLSSPHAGEYIFPLCGVAKAPQPQGPLSIKRKETVHVNFRNVFDASMLFSFQLRDCTVIDDTSALIVIARAIVAKMGHLWHQRRIPPRLKDSVFKTTVTAILVYECKLGTLSSGDLVRQALNNCSMYVVKRSISECVLENRIHLSSRKSFSH
ncbi:hydrocephalus-inducing protein [Clonorchis sinensis]|uniref:Hydrocephalus-inducing protein n=1 Tax=Clonorchis sinensis TaxID=79923 RepID=G7YBQ6_CLOSI|nr:hydrocephalus-inducing protein [Clonorchis sinensis]